MEKLKQMKEALVGCVQSQIYGNLETVDTKELGEAVDMIKDLSEAIYYCTITEAMHKEEKEGKDEKYMRTMPMYHMPYPVEYYDPRYRERYSMYATSGSGSSGSSGSGNSSGMSGSRNTTGDGGYDSSARGNNARGGGSRGYHESMIPYMYDDGTMYNMYSSDMMRDPKEGKSGQRRKMYMEGKMTHKDKTKSMQELDSYMQELANDMTEMIHDASPEEKQLLQQKIATLASKIK